MKIPNLLRFGFSLVFLSAFFIGCSGSHSSTSPNDAGTSDGDYVTAPSAIDPQPDSEMMLYLMDSSSFQIQGSSPRHPVPLSLQDSLTMVVNFAISKVSTNPSTHIPYVWGGRHIDRPTKWFSDDDLHGNGFDPPGIVADDNADCPARVGLDCSGFIQWIFDAVGFGRHSPDINVASLNNPNNWEFLKKRGYKIQKLMSPQPASLKVGDILFFQNASGQLSHIGIFCGTANTGNGIGPSFIASAGYPDCDANFQREANGKLTGVCASLLAGYWEKHLNSALRISNQDSMYGTIKLHVTMDGSQSLQEGDVLNEKTEMTTIDYTIKLPSVALTSFAGGGYSGTWQTTLSGSCDWSQETKSTYDCNGSSVTDVTDENWTLTGPDAATQMINVNLTMDGNGNYQFGMAPGFTGKPTHYTEDQTTNCPPPTHTSNEADQGGVPFSQYLTPYVGGALGFFQGSVNTDNLQSSWNYTDTYPIFNVGANPLTIPVNVQVTWSFIMN